MVDNSTIPVAVGNETFANKDVGGVKYPKSIITDSAGVNLGTVKAASTAAVAADTAVVVAIHPLSQNTNGQKTSINSAPVVVSSDQTFAGQNAATPANGIMAGGQFNTTPTTLVSGNVSPLQMDSAGNLLVNLKTPATLPVSATSLPLPAGASTAANQPTNAAQGAAITGVTGNMAQANATTAAPTYTTATVNPLSMDTAGNLRTSLNQGGNTAAVKAGATAAAGTDTSLVVTVHPNTNSLGTIPNLNTDLGTQNPLTAAAAGTTVSADIANNSASGAVVSIRVTAIGAATSVVFTLQGKDTVSNSYYNIISSASLSAINATPITLKVFKGATAVANAYVNDIVPQAFRIQAVVTGTGGVTATTGVMLIGA